MVKVRQGKLYIFEGIDHVGKSTIVNRVKTRLLNNGSDYSSYSYPGNEERSLGALIYQFHHNPEEYIDYPLNPSSLQLLHIAAHLDLLERCIIPDLKQGKTVLLDRSWWSTFAYGIANGIKRSQIKRITSSEVYIFEKLPIEKIFYIERNMREKDYSQTKEQRILAAYDDLVNQQSNHSLVMKIDNNRDIDAVIADIENVIHTIPQTLDQKVTTKRFNDNHSPTPTEIYNVYWKFATERQNVFFSKLSGDITQATTDPILLKYRFTNVYRASDRVSQYLIRNVIYSNNQDYSPENMLFRILLFKLFNKIETWEILEQALGNISYDEYSYKKYNDILNEQLLKQVRIYSAAYIMPSGKSSFGHLRKHQNHLALLEMIMKDGFSSKVAKARNLESLYHILLQYPTFGRFLAFQLSIDINYSQLCDFDEMSFVVAGPGAQNGIQKCFGTLGNYSNEDIIKYMAEKQQNEFERLGLDFKDLWGRPLQLIDCQNLFCEVDKYCRVAYPSSLGKSDRKRIKQKYRPSPRDKIDYFFPPKWNINNKIP